LNQLKELNPELTSMFEGELESKIKCKKCKKKQTQKEGFNIISLNIPKRQETLQNCLNNFFIKEEMEELINCEDCKSKTKMEKYYGISKFPNSLILHLKKYENFNYQIFFDEKINLFDQNYILNSYILHKGNI
jgi:uncharacterized UBP type Zn finger protein